MYRCILSSHAFLFLFRLPLVAVRLGNCAHVVRGLQETVGSYLTVGWSFLDVVYLGRDFHILEHSQPETKRVGVEHCQEVQHYGDKAAPKVNFDPVFSDVPVYKRGTVVYF